ncbi:hypothetical protein X975_14726, partial [Stegodyphus mimosarum]
MKIRSASASYSLWIGISAFFAIKILAVHYRFNLLYSTPSILQSLPPFFFYYIHIYIHTHTHTIDATGFSSHTLVDL